MTYRSLLVLLDADRRAEARVDYALRVGRETGCHVLGLAPTGLVPLTSEVSLESSHSLAGYAEAAWTALQQRAEAARARFETSCRGAGIASFESLTEHAGRAESIVRHSHCSDLVVLSQPDPTEPAWAGDHGFIADVILRCARPTLLVPFAGRFDTVASRVLVAWNDSREAARAIADALPLLRLARQVRVVTWSESGAADDSAWSGRQAALQRWLARHGVTAEMRVARTGIGLTETMLSHVAEVEADLFVMGAYGHSRWAERVLGGATRGMLATMTVPVLMSH